MTTPVPAIRTGRRLVNEDGDLVKVERVNLSKGTVRLKIDGGGAYSIGLRELRRALIDGDYAIAEHDEEEEEDENEDEDGDEEDDV